jgi:hypothetical protein
LSLRPTSTPLVIFLNHLFLQLANTYGVSRFSKHPVIEESKGVTYCVNYPRDAPSYHWDLTWESHPHISDYILN